MDLSRLADDKAGSDGVIRRRQHSGRDGLVIEGRCDRRNHLAEVAVVNGCRAGIAMMTRQYCRYLGPHNVRVNAIAPSLVEWEQHPIEDFRRQMPSEKTTRVG